MTEPSAEQHRLVHGARRLGVGLDDAVALRLLGLLDELSRWNRAYNLTAVRERRAMLGLHLLDSLSVLPALRGGRVLDVGTGAGFPGLVLALADPARQYTLLDSSGKKIRFVEHAIRTLMVGNALAVQARVEDYAPEQKFDTVIGRAFAPAVRFAALCEPLLAPGGQLLLMKGKHPQAELDALPARWRAGVMVLEVPEVAQDRHLVRLTLV